MSVGEFGKKLLIMSLVDNTMDTVGDFSSQKIRELILEKTGVEVENEFIEDWLNGFNAVSSMLVTSAILAGTTALGDFIIDKVTLSNIKNMLYNLRNFSNVIGSVATGSLSHVSTDIILGKSQGTLSEQKLAHYTYLNTAIQSRGTVLNTGSSMARTLTSGIQAQSVIDNNNKVSIPQGQKLVDSVTELKNMSKQGI